MLKKLSKIIYESVFKDILYKLNQVDYKCNQIDKKLEKVDRKLDKIIGDDKDKGDEK